MQYKTVILDSNNWALGTSDIKHVLHWSTRDRPWYNIRTFAFKTVLPIVPCCLKSLNWREAEMNADAKIDRSIHLESLLMGARIKLFTELYMKLEASKENLGINDHAENMLLLHEYLVSHNVIQGTFQPDAKLTYENRIKLISDLHTIREKIVTMGLSALSKEQFDEVRLEMDRLFFTNILL